MINLQKPGEFSVAVCHVMDPSDFYVSPNQEGSAKTLVSGVLFDCLSEDFSVAVTDRDEIQ